MEQNKNSSNESKSTNQQQIYQDIIKQPLAPMVLRIGVINLNLSLNTQSIQATISQTFEDIARNIADIAKLPSAKQIYNTEKPTLRLVSSFGLTLPVSQLVSIEHFQIDETKSLNQTKLNKNSYQVSFDSSIQETNGGENLVANQVIEHSDVLLIVADSSDSGSSSNMMAKLLSDGAENQMVPLIIQISVTQSNPTKVEVALLRSTSNQLHDCLSEIILFDSLLNACSESEGLSESKLKSHTLNRIADFVAEDSLAITEEKSDFDYQGPIKAKRSILSWRNVFTRFINFLSPIKKQPELNSQNSQSRLDSADRNLFAMRGSNACHYLYALFMRSDQLAIQYANAHRSSFILIYCLGAFALINAAIAIGFSEIGWLALSSALAEFFALIAIFLIYRNDHKKRYHIKWLEYRSLAEILRISPHLNSLGMVFTTQGLDRHRAKENESNLSAHSVGRTWLIIYSETIKRWLDRSDISISQETLTQGKSFLTNKLIAGQISYHHKNAHRMHYAGHSLGKFSFILFVLALGFVSGKLLTKLLVGMELGFDPIELHHVGHYLGVLAAICPMLGSAAFAIRNHAEFDISSQRSQTMLKKLNLQIDKFQQLPQPIPYQELQQTCQETALIMQSETADWLEIYEVKETEPA